MKTLFLLLMFFICMNSSISGQNPHAGDNLIKSANYKLLGYACFGGALALISLSPENQKSADIAIFFAFSGFSLHLMSAIELRKAGRNMNRMSIFHSSREAGLHLKTNQHGLTLAYHF